MMSMHEKVKNGISLKDNLIIDVHCHMGFDGSQFIPDGSPKALINAMDNVGIAMACVSHGAALSPDYKWGNGRIMEAIQEYPGRFIGYCTINPHYPEEIPGEMERCFGFDGMKGIKIHPWFHERTMGHKNYKVVYEFAARKGCHILAHIYSVEEINNMDRYATDYPDAVFLMGHTGGEVAYMEAAIEVINRHDNIYADITGSEAREGIVEWLVREVGSRKILFGSDMPYFETRSTIARVAMAEISEEEKKDILGLNMKKILRRR